MAAMRLSNLFGDCIMRPVKRSRVSKYRSAKRFRRNTMVTKSPNMSLQPMRGGWRL